MFLMVVFVAVEAAIGGARDGVKTERVAETEQVAAELEQDPKVGLDPEPQNPYL
jgi:hypothetical protein